MAHDGSKRTPHTAANKPPGTPHRHIVRHGLTLRLQLPWEATMLRILRNLVLFRVQCRLVFGPHCWPLDMLNLYKRSHNGCQVRLLQRINTQIPNRLVCLHRCQQCYAHQVPSIPDALEINLIPDIDTHTQTRDAKQPWVFFGDSCLYEVHGTFPRTLEWAPPLLICGSWAFS